MSALILSVAQDAPTLELTPFMPQLEFVSSFKSLDYGNWYIIPNHTVLIKHPNINISLCSADRSKVESFRSPILSFWTLPRSHYSLSAHLCKL